MASSVEQNYKRNTWAVIVDGSRYFYNYRHASNALSFYRTVKRLGIPDNHIILMLADDVACSARNAEPGKIFNDPSSRLDLYGEEIEVDFRGEEVTVENFLRLLTGRQLPDTPRSKRLLTDADSYVMLFITAHGGDRFLKFQDSESIDAHDFGNALYQMHKQNRYRRVLSLIDSCQSATHQMEFTSPNIVSCGSSVMGQNSYSHYDDSEIGVAVIDRFTYRAYQFLEGIRPDSNTTLLEFFSIFDRETLGADIGVRSDLSDTRLEDLHLTSFFAASGPTAEVQFTDDSSFINGLQTDQFPLKFSTVETQR